MKIKLLYTFLLTLFASLGFAESLQSLSKDKVTELVKGNTLTTMPIVTLKNKQQSNTWTGYFGEDGNVVAKLSKKPSDSPREDKGTWKVDDDGLLCIHWQKWMAESTTDACIYLYEVNNAYVLINKDGNFESVFVKHPMKGKHI